MSRALKDAIRTYDEAAAGISAGTLGGLCMLRGRYVDAARWLREALVHLEYHDPFWTVKCAHALLAGVAYHMGDRKAWRQRWSAAGRRSRATWSIPSGRTWFEARHGSRWRSATRPVHSGCSWIARRASASPSTRCSCTTRRCARARRRAGWQRRWLRCGTNATRVWRWRMRTTRWRERSGRQRPCIACADEFEAIGALRHASECAAAAAEIFIQAGRQDSARRAAARSRELHQRCQGGSAPQVRGLDPDALSLTERERQLVELAAQGLSNPEIADRLVLSVRTVESHLYRAMQKLGVKDRRDLPIGLR